MPARPPARSLRPLPGAACGLWAPRRSVAGVRWAARRRRGL